MRIVHTISRYLTGIIFVASGLAKGIDPAGTTIKLGEYLASAGFEAGDSILLVAAILLSTVEFIAGFYLLAGVRTSLASILALILMSVFTPLTFILALYNPVTDCGCFGDLVHLTNWQTFYKNIALTIPVIIVYSGRKDLVGYEYRRMEWLIAISSLILFVLFNIFNHRYLPVSDFRPYKVGVNILDGMSIPEDAPVDEYETTLLYKKDGRVEEFRLEDYPSDDTTWTFVDQKSRLISKGYEAPIHDFNLTDIQGYDRTYEILTDPGYSFMMTARDPEIIDPEIIKTGLESGINIRDAGLNFYFVTSSVTGMATNYLPGTDILFLDATALKTFIRSEPGYVLINGGTIIKKWSWRCMPDQEKIKRLISSNGKERVPRPYLRYLLILTAIILLAVGAKFALTKIPSET